MRKNFLLFLKLFLLFVIFFWIIKSVNVNETFTVLTKINLFYFLLAFVLNNLSNLFLTIKWYRLALPLKIQSDFFNLLKLNYISIFYSSLIPGQASGELIKGLKLTKSEGSSQKVWVPIFIDKITNLLIVFIIGFVAVLFDKDFRHNTSLVFIISFLTILLSFITIILFSDNTAKIAEFTKDSLARFLVLFKIKNELLNNFSLKYVEAYKKHDLLMLETLIWSLLIKLPHIFVFYILALSLNINLTVIESAWLFSIVSIVTLLPFSFSGLGIREGIIIVILSRLGVETSSALSLSILIFTVGILTALIGGIFELLSGLKEIKNK